MDETKMKTKTNLFRLGALLPAIALLLLALSACSEPGWWRWRTSPDGVARVQVYVRPQGQTASLASAAQNAVAQWNRHPLVDLQFRSTPCPLGGDSYTEPHCFAVWWVPPQLMSGGAWGLAYRYPDASGYLYNGTEASPARVQVSTGIGNLAAERNAVCHEVGHLLGLDHWDTNDDGRPDAEGPCVDGVPDQTDFEALTTLYTHPPSNGRTGPAVLAE